MTRRTCVAVLTPGINPMDMWRKMATLINAPEQYRFDATPTGIHADLDQGLCALMDLTYDAVDLAGTCQLIRGHTHDETCEADCDASDWDPAHYLMASFDTAYSYDGPCGCHSGGLHLQLVAGLGTWLDEQGAAWRWYDESGDGWAHGPGWGTLGNPHGACPTHRAIPAPSVVS